MNRFQKIFNAQKALFATGVTRTYEWRVDQLDRMAASAQGVAGRARLEPRDHAGDLAGADVEGGHERSAILRHRARLRRLVARQAAHASPTFFFGFFSLNNSSRALAASSDN